MTYVSIAYRKHFLMFLFLLSGICSSLAQGTWSDASAVGFTPRTYACAAVVNSKLYVIGGFPSPTTPSALNTIEVYDPGKDEWTTPEVTGQFTPRGGCTATVVNGKIYVIGGYDENWQVTNIVQVYDPATLAWTTPTITGQATARHRHGAALFNGKIYIVGGAAQASYDVPVEIFDIETNTWSTPKTSGSYTPRRAAQVVEIQNKIYVHGGYNGSKALNTLEMFDPASNTWSTPPADISSSARYGGTAAVLNNTMYNICGFNLQQMVNQIESYNPLTNEWNIEKPDGLFTPRSGVVSGAINGRIYVVGGATLSGMAPVNEVYTPGTSDAKSPLNEGDLQIYPNPCSSLVVLRNLPPHHTDILVTNLLGEKVLEVVSQSESDLQLNLGTIPSGMYVLQLRTRTGESLRKIIRKAH